MERSPNANLNRCRSEREACIPFKRDNSPSPHSYAMIDKNWKRQSHIQEIAQSNAFPKTKVSSYLDIVTKTKSYIPGVAKYDTSAQRMDRLSKGPQPRFKKGR
jgi:hypothetical protein